MADFHAFQTSKLQNHVSFSLKDMENEVGRAHGVYFCLDALVWLDQMVCGREGEKTEVSKAGEIEKINIPQKGREKDRFRMLVWYYACVCIAEHVCNSFGGVSVMIR